MRRKRMLDPWGSSRSRRDRPTRTSSVDCVVRGGGPLDARYYRRSYDDPAPRFERETLPVFHRDSDHFRPQESRPNAR